MKMVQSPCMEEWVTGAGQLRLWVCALFGGYPVPNTIFIDSNTPL